MADDVALARKELQESEKEEASRYDLIFGLYGQLLTVRETGKTIFMDGRCARTSEDLLKVMDRITNLGDPKVPPHIQALHARGEFKHVMRITGKLVIDYRRHMTAVRQLIAHANNPENSQDFLDSIGTAAHHLRRIALAEAEFISAEVQLLRVAS